MLRSVLFLFPFLLGCLTYPTFQLSEEQKRAIKEDIAQRNKEIDLLIFRLGVYGQASKDVRVSYDCLQWWIHEKRFKGQARIKAFEHIGDLDGNGKVDEVDQVIVGYLTAFQIGYTTTPPENFSIKNLEEAASIGMLSSQLGSIDGSSSQLTSIGILLSRLGDIDRYSSQLRLGFSSFELRPLSIKNLQKWKIHLPVLLNLWDEDDTRENNQELFRLIHAIFADFVSLGRELFVLEVEKRLKEENYFHGLEPAEKTASPFNDFI